MSTVCNHLFRDGRRCGRRHGPQFDACSNHRAKPAARPRHECISCGLPTTIASKHCCRPECPGITQYRQIATANRIKANEVKHKLMNQTQQDEIDAAEVKLAEALAQIEVFKAHIEALKAALP